MRTTDNPVVIIELHQNECIREDDKQEEGNTRSSKTSDLRASKTLKTYFHHSFIIHCQCLVFSFLDQQRSLGTGGDLRAIVANMDTVSLKGKERVLNEVQCHNPSDCCSCCCCSGEAKNNSRQIYAFFFVCLEYIYFFSTGNEITQGYETMLSKSSENHMLIGTRLCTSKPFHPER